MPTVQKQRKKREVRSPQDRAAGIKAQAGSLAWGLLRSAMAKDAGIAKMADGIVRARRDVRRFGLYSDKAKVEEKAAALEARAQKVRELGARVQNGDIARSDMVEIAAKGFNTLSTEITRRIIDSQEVSETTVSELFQNAFPSNVRKNLTEYASAEDPFAGTEDESEDEDEDENAE